MAVKSVPAAMMISSRLMLPSTRAIPAVLHSTFQGEVIGVNTAIFSPSGGNVGIAFAIPASTSREIVNELIDKGSVVRGWLGVQIQPVTKDIAEALDLEEARVARW